MTIEEMRMMIKQPYQYPSWYDKCNRMPDSQVVAVFYSFKKKGIFDKKKNKKDNYIQMTLFDESLEGHL